jgi:hypothetical protein
MSDQVKENEMSNTCSRWRDKKCIDGKRPLRGPRCKWDDIKMYLKEIGWLWTEFTWLRIGTSGRLM